MKYWLPLATQDYAEAQYRLGTLYRLGIGVPKDYGKAFQWFSRAAKLGHAKAKLNLGVMYENGWGTKRDEDQAKRFYRQAAKLKVDIAQKRLDLLLNKSGSHVDTLVDNGSRKEKLDINKELLSEARHGDVGKVVGYIKLGAKANYTDENGRTLLMEAAFADHVKVVDTLIKKGAKVNLQDKFGNTALILAASRGNSSVIGRLAKAGALVNAQDKLGNSALSIAASNNYTKVVPILLKAGADINLVVRH